MTVIDTHQVLYSYDRLAFGISSAPALLWWHYESLLRDLPRARVYLASQSPQNNRTRPRFEKSVPETS
ncbi:hypothetical protein MRX96_011638 [Rhipicephalus microplus]